MSVTWVEVRKQCLGANFLLPTYVPEIVTSAFSFWAILLAILGFYIGLQRYPIIMTSSICLMTNEVEHLFMCLFFFLIWWNMFSGCFHNFPVSFLFLIYIYMLCVCVYMFKHTVVCVYVYKYMETRSQCPVSSLLSIFLLLLIRILFFKTSMYL